MCLGSDSRGCRKVRSSPLGSGPCCLGGLTTAAFLTHPFLQAGMNHQCLSPAAPSSPLGAVVLSVS